MISVIFEDNVKFEAKTYEDLVMAMKMDMWLPSPSQEVYMDGVANRCEVWDGSRIEYSNAEGFIHELLRVGAIKMLHDGR